MFELSARCVNCTIEALPTPFSDLGAGTNLEFPNVGTGRTQQQQRLVKVYGYKLRTQR